MASLSAVTKAEAIGYGIQQVFGATPSYDYSENNVRIYFDADNLPIIRKSIETMVNPKPGAQAEVTIDWLPAITPAASKKVVPIAAALLLAGFLLGKL